MSPRADLDNDYGGSGDDLCGGAAADRAEAQDEKEYNEAVENVTVTLWDSWVMTSG